MSNHEENIVRVAELVRLVDGTSDRWLHARFLTILTKQHSFHVKCSRSTWALATLPCFSSLGGGTAVGIAETIEYGEDTWTGEDDGCC